MLPSIFCARNSCWEPARHKAEGRSPQRAAPLRGHIFQWAVGERETINTCGEGDEENAEGSEVKVDMSWLH